MKKMLLLFVMLCSLQLVNAQTSVTYNTGDIPTSNTAFDPTCNGPMATLIVNIPAGDFVTSIDVSYDIEATGGAWMSEQSSQIYCQDTGMDEGGYINGVGGPNEGVESYNRTNLGIANGVDADGVLTFEMRAYRAWGGALCDTDFQFVPTGTWMITVYHEAPPSCLPVSNIATANATGATVDVSWTENGTATTWDIEVVEEGSAPTGTPTDNNVGNPHTLNTVFNSNYEYYIRADCGADDTNVSTWNGPFYFSNSYCTPSPASVDGEGIMNVTMGTINNTTSNEANNYGDYSALSADAPQGLPLAVDITLGTGYTYYLWAWVDWNNDLDFNDPGEEIYLGESDAQFNTTFSTSIMVPLTASIGNHLIRFGGSDFGLGTTSPSNPCYTGAYASFEDYTLNVMPPPSCQPVLNLLLSNITAYTADIAWDVVGSETNWDIEVVAEGDVPAGVPTYNDVTTIPFTLINLDPSTTYKVYIRADCAGDDADVSIWIPSGNFTTPCVSINQFPACENFAENNTPDCWSSVGGTNWSFDTDAFYGATSAGDHTGGGGTNYAYIGGFGINTGELYELYTPFYDVSSLTSPFLSYWVFSNNTESVSNNILYVELWDGANWIAVETIQGNNTEWVEYTIDINQITSITGDIQFKFVYAPNSPDYYFNQILLDDICVKERPLNDIGITNIIAPSSGCGLGVEEVTIEILNLGFNTQGGFFTGYSVNGVVQNIIPDGFISDNITAGESMPFTFDLQYDFSSSGVYVIKAWTELNGDSDVSNDTFELVINSLELIDTYPYLEDFETTNGGYIPNNTLNNATTTWEFGNPTGSVIDAAASGANAWVTNLAGNYEDNTITYLESPCFDFSNFELDPELSFAIRYETEDFYDGAWVELSLDAGFTWSVLGTLNDPDWYNAGFVNQFQGDNSVWTVLTHDITGAAGQGDVRIRFGFESDGFGSAFDGVGIDDISIVDVCDAALGLSATITNESVQGESLDGAATVVVSGNSGPYTYAWSTGGTTDTELGLSTGIYTVTVSNDMGCVDEINVEVGFSCMSNILEEITYVEETQNGVTNDGSVTVQVNSVPPYTYNWSTGASNTNSTGTDTQTGLTAGLYEVTIEDANGCVVTDAIVVTAICPLNLGATSSIQHESVEGQADGSIVVTPVSGLAPYTYTWNTGENTNVASGLTAGTYSVTIEDDNGCEEVLSIDINSTCPVSIAGTINAYPETTENANDGAASVMATNGVGPYQYDWSNGAVGNTIVDLAPGTYTVTITDSNNCTGELSAEVQASDLNTPVEDIETLSNLMILPNPTTGRITISAKFTTYVNLNVELTSIVGQKINSFTFNQTKGEDLEVDLSNMASGIYFVRLTVDGAVHSSRVVKH